MAVYTIDNNLNYIKLRVNIMNQCHISVSSDMAQGEGGVIGN